MAKNLVDGVKSYCEDYLKTFDETKNPPCSPENAQAFLLRNDNWLAMRELRSNHLKPPTKPTARVTWEIFTLAKQAFLHNERYARS